MSGKFIFMWSPTLFWLVAVIYAIGSLHFYQLGYAFILLSTVTLGETLYLQIAAISNAMAVHKLIKRLFYIKNAVNIIVLIAIFGEVNTALFRMFLQNNEALIDIFSFWHCLFTILLIFHGVQYEKISK